MTIVEPCLALNRDFVSISINGFTEVLLLNGIIFLAGRVSDIFVVLLKLIEVDSCWADGAFKVEISIGALINSCY